MGRNNSKKRFKIKYIYNIHDFQQYKTMRSFGESIYNRKAKIVESEEDQNNLLKNIVKFNNKSGPETKEGKDKKEILTKVYMLFMKVEN